MPVTITVPDGSLTGLSVPARDQLSESVGQFATDLISEANRLEGAARTDAREPEISAQMVKDAAEFVRRGLAKKRASIWMRVCRVGAALSGLLIGIMWDKEKLQEITYLIAFIVIISIAIALTMISTFKE
jgi:hypothetical protein